MRRLWDEHARQAKGKWKGSTISPYIYPINTYTYFACRVCLHWGVVCCLILTRKHFPHFEDLRSFCFANSTRGASMAIKSLWFAEASSNICLSVGPNFLSILINVAALPYPTLPYLTLPNPTLAEGSAVLDRDRSRASCQLSVRKNRFSDSKQRENENKCTWQASVW